MFKLWSDRWAARNRLFDKNREIKKAIIDNQNETRTWIGVGAPGRLLYDVAIGFMKQEDINMIVMPKFRNERFEETTLLAWVATYGMGFPINIAPRKIEDAYYDLKEAGQIIYPDLAATKRFPIDLDRYMKTAADPLWINPQGGSYTFDGKNEKKVWQKNVGVNAYKNLQDMHDTLICFQDAGSIICDSLGFKTREQMKLSKEMQQHVKIAMPLLYK